jgi:phosphatidate cytidylyltransferase
LGQRIVSAAILLPLLILAVWVGGIWFTIIVAGVAAVAALELVHISSAGGVRSGPSIAALPTVAVVIYAHYVPVSGSVAPVLAWLSTTAAIASMVWFLLAVPPGGPTGQVLLTLGVVALVGGTLLHAPLLREIDEGRQWVIYLLAVVFASDTGAFFVGRGLGRHKLAPGISPGKTWEGAAGGVAGGIAASVAAIGLQSGLEVSLVTAVGAGVGLSIVGQLGDLGESRIKRLAGAKDSGVLVPGHGGIMDRLDSVVWTLVVVYHFVS